jgi:hypothetical protein
MTKHSENTELSNSTKPVLCAVFDPMDYAYDNYPNCINHMSQEEIEQINTYDNRDDLVEYMVSFIDRT